MFESILKVLGAGLTLWSDKEKSKYQDKYIKLKRAIYEEENKPANERSDAVLDNLAFELCLLGDSFSARVGEQNPTPKP